MELLSLRLIRNHAELSTFAPRLPLKPRGDYHYAPLCFCYRERSLFSSPQLSQTHPTLHLHPFLSGPALHIPQLPQEPLPQLQPPFFLRRNVARRASAITISRTHIKKISIAPIGYLHKNTHPLTNVCLQKSIHSSIQWLFLQPHANQSHAKCCNPREEALPENNRQRPPAAKFTLNGSNCRYTWGIEQTEYQHRCSLY